MLFNKKKLIFKEAINVKQLRREYEIQKNLKHPNIIILFTSFETENEIIFVSEYAKLDLHRLLEKEGTLDEERARKLSYDLISALYYLHSHRILHRDLKPQNILIDDENRAKLCDFGLARSMGASTHILTSIKVKTFWVENDKDCKTILF